jgi:uncharacterized membrane protein (DUF373 family)
VLDVLKKFEHFIIKALIVMMSVVLVFATLELGWRILKGVVSPPLFQMTLPTLMNIFGLFMLILIGLELLESVKAYLEENVFHVEVIIVVAMIAIARKVIILDIKKTDFLTMLGIAGIVLSFGVSYYLIVQSRAKKMASPE